ncbi:NAD(P)-dependent oxidoreductase [Orrella marina]|uniref:NAD(P)-dependent oxidoreductase n=1 Tax=Orrella marina TaxID=2163011 RepID=A0A2R4XGH2_9BURK|nr:NAD(P)-dependent oxidoreductase [Orrella marina]AWB32922.1 NAD(P)-dependent oxidoreductase [Orrella marina]
MEIGSVAFIGVGNMGSRMAACVKQAGFDLRVHDANLQACESLVKSGVSVLSEAAESIQSDVIVLMVANDDQVKQVTRQIVQAGLRDTRFVADYLCIMSTVLPQTVKEVARELDKVEIRLIEAPVSGGMVKAEQGSLTLMLGGAEEDITAVNPVMKAMGSHLFYCGKLGSASVVKLINNMIGISNLYLVAEGFRMAQAYGVCCENLTRVLEVSTGRNFLTEDAQISAQQYAAWTQTEEVFLSASKIVQKDLHIAQDLARAVSVTLPVIAAVSGVVDATGDTDLERWRAVADYFTRAEQAEGNSSHG